ncbi:hypothetical protein L211DRAFT_347441 [Terfezia boudieri ATCC MYA-4762]|uniref:Uncharacterized protein n=1 Tax=Terfezia boudieri ATCC MYA-4762 TaxID=1051890 RepID=A0A3N4LHF7_9PEZI|nr:hypothetical protein L211DRAFT_347441 [Terfezia boudieri ATCC MYA-4762]
MNARIAITFSLTSFKMRLLNLTSIFLSLTFLPSAIANVEKVIFLLNPPPDPPLQLTRIPSNLLRLNPNSPRLSTTLDLTTNITGRERDAGGNGGIGEGESTIWAVLEKLILGKRYEVRIIWAATEPAKFELEVFTGKEEANNGALGSSQGIVMYLRVLAKKDPYNPDPVKIELILDPFLWNILPESLLCIGVVVVLVAGAAWWVSGRVERWLSMVARQQRREKVD